MPQLLSSVKTMPTTANSSSVLAPAPSRAAFDVKMLFSATGLLALAVIACWALFFDELRGEWAVNAQYNYGYVVPFLGLALLWRRWSERPPISSREQIGLAAAAGAALIFFVLPFEIVLEANPEWRLIYWINGAQVIALTFCLIYCLGGWRWVRYFAPPLLFVLIAVPWPMEMEAGIIQGLMRLVAGWTVEIAGWLNIPAVQHGNLIEVGAGIVGIDEACSGVRSLQSALMLSFFLGEMHRFSWTRRGALVLGSLLFVVMANLGRTTFLVWAAANRGLQQMEAWHDTAGILVMLFVLPGLIGLAFMMKPKSSAVPAVAPAPFIIPTLPRWPGIVALLWIILALGATEIWYRTHESKLVPNTRWSVNWPSQSPQFKKTALPQNSLAILRCSNSDAAVWQDDDGNQWSGFLLRWQPGKNSAQLSKGHRPDICFPASGARLVKDFGEIKLQAEGFQMPFRYETFESGPTVLHVFYCLWSDRRAALNPSLTEDGTRNSRLQAVLSGKRHLGQQVLEIVLRGPESDDEAISIFKRELPNLVHQQ
jgi:exosortase